MKKAKKIDPVFMVVDGDGFAWTSSASKSPDSCYHHMEARGVRCIPFRGDRIIEFRPYIPRKKAKKKGRKRA